MLLPELHLGKAYQIASQSGLINARSRAMLVVYYVTTVIAALLDGLGLVVLVSLLTGEFLKAKADPVTSSVVSILSNAGLEPSSGSMLAVAVALLSVKTACNFAIDVAEAKFLAHIRLEMQRAQLRGILGAGWERLRDRRVGRMTAALIEETALACKYMVVAIRGGYCMLSALVFGVIALSVSAELTFLLAAVALPVIALLRRLFGAQSRLSIAQAQVRQTLAADLTERLNNLFQIKLEGNEPVQHGKALQRGPEVAALEVKIGWGLALIASTNALVLLVGLGAFYLWSLWRGIVLTDAFALLAGVGIVGSKAATHANNALTTIGNLARLAGSIVPVHELVFLPPEKARQPIPEKVTRVELRSVTYRYAKSAGLFDVNLAVEAGSPLLVRGPSGSGKTTLANLIAGVYLPAEGSVVYVTKEGTRYDSRGRRARVGYVPQDISLFHGSVRENLQPHGETLSDDEHWRFLEQVGAAGFVYQIGGLDATLLEGGRSLSGGERRRLGIGRVLASRPDILILDEIMNGLDAERKTEISALVDVLSRDLVMVAITHDPQEFSGWREWRTADPVSAPGS